MTLDELKQEIQQNASVPASLLTGETAEECIAQAKALLAYKREYGQQRPKSNAEQFAEWLRAKIGIEEDQDTAGAALAGIEERARVDAGGYPCIRDSGEMMTGGADPRTTREQFTDWFRQISAFNPFK